MSDINIKQCLTDYPFCGIISLTTKGATLYILI